MNFVLAIRKNNAKETDSAVSALPFDRANLENQRDGETG
jgi:hypothetical protein